MASGKVHVYVKPKKGEKPINPGVIRTSAKGEIINPKKKKEKKEFDSEQIKDLVSKVVVDEKKDEIVEPRTEKVEQIQKENVQEECVGASMKLGEHVHSLHKLQSDFGAVLSEIETKVEMDIPKIREEEKREIAVDPYIHKNEPTRVLEAALFMAGRGIDSDSLSKVIGVNNVSEVQKMMERLEGEYAKRGSAIEITQDSDKKWFMRVKSSYAPAVKQFAGEAEISKRALRTLAYVSKNNGVTKRNLFKRLGGSIYEDALELEQKGFISTTPFGRTKKVYLTQKFRDYFEM